MQDSLYSKIAKNPIEIEKMTRQAQDRIKKKKDAAEKFWELAEQYKTTILNFNPLNPQASADYGMLTFLFKSQEPTYADAPEIKNNGVTPFATRIKLSLQSVPETGVYWLSEVWNRSKYYNYQNPSAGCGQWLCAFLVTAYGYKNIPHTQIKTEIEERCGIFGAAMRLTDLSRVIGRYSDEYLSADYNSRSEWDIYWYIIQNKAPAFRLTWAGGEMHWTLLFATYRDERALGTDYYYMQIDNGAMVGPERFEWIPLRKEYYRSLGFADLLYEVCD